MSLFFCWCLKVAQQYLLPQFREVSDKVNKIWYPDCSFIPVFIYLFIYSFHHSSLWKFHNSTIYHGFGRWVINKVWGSDHTAYVVVKGSLNISVQAWMGFEPWPLYFSTRWGKRPIVGWSLCGFKITRRRWKSTYNTCESHIWSAEWCTTMTSNLAVALHFAMTFNFIVHRKWYTKTIS